MRQGSVEPFLREPISGEPQLYCSYVAPPFGGRIWAALTRLYRALRPHLGSASFTAIRNSTQAIGSGLRFHGKFAREGRPEEIIR